MAGFAGRVFGYVRVSTQDQADSGLGLEAARAAVHRAYERKYKPKGFAFAAVYEDAAVSGRKPLASRDGGNAMMREAARGDVIVFPKLDRGFRNTLDCLKTIKVLRARGVRTDILNLPFRPSTSVGKLMLGVMALIAEFERNCIRDRTKVAIAAYRRRCEEKGELFNQSNRFGLRRVGAKGQRRYAVVPEEWADGSYIVEKYDRGFTLDEIAYHMNLNIERTGTKRRWTRDSVRRAYLSMLQLRIWAHQKTKDGRPLIEVPRTKAESLAVTEGRDASRTDP